MLAAGYRTVLPINGTAIAALVIVALAPSS
jgi:hypothetical protein